MRLHYRPNSTYSRRVRIALIEKQLEAELAEVDFESGANRAPPYLALNPYGRVPTLEDDGFVLFESTAILEYLEAKHPAPPLRPGDPRGRGRCAMHMKLCDLEIGAHSRALIFPARFVPREKWDLAAMDAARAHVARHLAIVDGQLGGGPWLLGDAYTLADVCYTPFAQFFAAVGLAPPARVADWVERLLARPSARATVPAR